MNFLEIYKPDFKYEYNKIIANHSVVIIYFKNYTNLSLSNEISVTLSARVDFLRRHCLKMSKLDPLEPLYVFPKLLRKYRGICTR
jgi:hypothetical protein